MDARAGSLWHKRAGVAIPRSTPRHRGGPLCVGGLTRIEELYPDCPRSPIYAVVDLTKKRKRPTNLPDLVTLGGLTVSQSSDKYLTNITTEEKTNKMVKSHSANNSPTYANQELLLLDNEIAPAKTKHSQKKRKHKKKREDAERGVTFTEHKGNRPG